jgi:hypothetical protein
MTPGMLTLACGKVYLLAPYYRRFQEGLNAPYKIVLRVTGRLDRYLIRPSTGIKTRQLRYFHLQLELNTVGV